VVQRRTFLCWFHPAWSKFVHITELNEIVMWIKKTRLNYLLFANYENSDCYLFCVMLCYCDQKYLRESFKRKNYLHGTWFQMFQTMCAWQNTAVGNCGGGDSLHHSNQEAKSKKGTRNQVWCSKVVPPVTSRVCISTTFF
jgi:hypothetical protein